MSVSSTTRDGFGFKIALPANLSAYGSSFVLHATTVLFGTDALLVTQIPLAKVTKLEDNARGLSIQCGTQELINIKTPTAKFLAAIARAGKSVAPDAPLSTFEDLSNPRAHAIAISLIQLAANPRLLNTSSLQLFEAAIQDSSVPDVSLLAPGRFSLLPLDRTSKLVTGTTGGTSNDTAPCADWRTGR
jgi:hypothetical protein